MDESEGKKAGSVALAFLLRTMNDIDAPMMERTKAAQALLPYMDRKMPVAVEVSGDVGQKVIFQITGLPPVVEAIGGKNAMVATVKSVGGESVGGKSVDVKGEKGDTLE